MPLYFSKMHGLGNDFMVIDAVRQEVTLTKQEIKQWGDRNFGIGFDQLLIVEPPSRPDIDFRYRIFNQDGGEVEQCGNGARCFARFVHDKGLTGKQTIVVETAGGIIELHLQDDGQVTVDMGKPRLVPADIPFTTDEQAAIYHLDPGEGWGPVEVGAVSMGNPHAVMKVEDVVDAPVNELGAVLERHEQFPARVNVGFIQIMNRREARLRVFERGVGETLACGTGACAAMVVARLNNWVDDTLECELPGGKLTLSWNGHGSVMMTGPAEFVFDGILSQEGK